MATIEDQSAVISDGSLGHSDKNNLSLAFPGAPQHGAAPLGQLNWVTAGPMHEADFLELNDEGLKKGYANNVMNGYKTDFINSAHGNFPEGVDLDYGSGTEDESKKPPLLSEVYKEEADGGDNTIVESGLGPTSSTLDIASTTNPGEGIPVTDSGNTDGGAFAGPFGSESPSVTSADIAAGGLYGGAGLDEKPAPGISNASTSDA